MASGMVCQGGGAYTPFKIERPKLHPSDWPKLTDVTLKSGKSTAA